MIVKTESGSEYRVRPADGYLDIAKGAKSCKGIALFPDRVSFAKSTVVTRRLPNGRSQGFNAKGKKTIEVIPDRVEKGMVLFNRAGLLSTKIIEIYR